MIALDWGRTLSSRGQQTWNRTPGIPTFKKPSSQKLETYRVTANLSLHSVHPSLVRSAQRGSGGSHGMALHGYLVPRPG